MGMCTGSVQNYDYKVDINTLPQDLFTIFISEKKLCIWNTSLIKRENHQ